MLEGHAPDLEGLLDRIVLAEAVVDEQVAQSLLRQHVRYEQLVLFLRQVAVEHAQPRLEVGGDELAAVVDVEEVEGWEGGARALSAMPPVRARAWGARLR